MAKIYVVTSGKGGVGKTTTAINLGAAFNSMGENVVVVDANLTTPNVGLYLGAPIAPITLNHVLRDEAEIHEAIYEHDSGTKIIPSDLSIKELKKLKLDKFSEITNNLKNYSDIIILDSPAGLGEESLKVIEAGEELIIVTHPEIPSVTDALKTIKVADEKGKTVRGVIITRYKGKPTEMSLTSIREMLEIPVLGIVPEEKKMQESLARKDAIYHTHPKSKAAKAYDKVARKILGRPIKEDSLFEKVLRKVGL